MSFERIKGRKSKALDNLYDRTLVLEFKDGKVYGGYLDGYEEGIIYLYGCKRLDKKSSSWKDHGIMVEFEGKEIEDYMPAFYLSQVQDIYALSSSFDDEGIDLIDLLQLYLDPNHKFLKGIKCEGGPEKKHSAECDNQLHEALVLLTSKSYNGARDAKERENLLEATDIIRKRLLSYGAKIP